MAEPISQPADVPLAHGGVHQRNAQPAGLPGPAGLELVGVTAAEEHVYRALLARPGATLKELSEATARTPAQLRALLQTLEGKGLASRSATRPVRYTPAPPDTALEVLILQRQHALEQVRRTAATLSEALRAARHTTASGVEIITGREAITQRITGLQQTAHTEVMIIDKPPYVAPTGPPALQLQLDSMHRGVTWRGLYDTASLAHPDILETTRQLAAAGEHSRVHDSVPLKLFIADRQLAILPLELPVERETMLLHASPLLDALIMLFDMLWQHATPLWPPARRPHPPTPEGHPDPQQVLDQQLLALLAAGLTDQAIARQLDIGQRTVERHLSRIMTDLGAKTRFQAGVQATTRGWLTSTDPATAPSQP